MRHAAFLATLLLLGAESSALAQDDRFALEKSDAGVIRLDRKTGEVSLCATEGANLVCKLAADERTAYQDEIDRLQRSVGNLEERVGKLETSLPQRLGSSLPSEEEFKTTLSYMERFMRTFMGVVKDVEESDGSNVAPGDPDKT